MAKMIFEKFESKESIESIHLYMQSRKKIIHDLIDYHKDYYVLRDSRFLFFAGFPLYVSEDGKGLTTDLTKAKIVEGKKLKELKSFASSYQEIELINFDELVTVGQEIEALLSNY